MTAGHTTHLRIYMQKITVFYSKKSVIFCGFFQFFAFLSKKTPPGRSPGVKTKSGFMPTH